MSSFLEPTGNILAATARMQADTSPDSTNLAKFRRELDALHQSVEQKTVWNPIMEFYATTFDNVHDVMRRNDCTEDMSARLVGIETYLVTDYVIGDAASSGRITSPMPSASSAGLRRTTESGGERRVSSLFSSTTGALFLHKKQHEREQMVTPPMHYIRSDCKQFGGGYTEIIPQCRGEPWKLDSSFCTTRIT